MTAGVCNNPQFAGPVGPQQAVRSWNPIFPRARGGDSIWQNTSASSSDNSIARRHAALPFNPRFKPIQRASSGEMLAALGELLFGSCRIAGTRVHELSA